MQRIGLAKLEHTVTGTWRSSGGFEIRVGTAGNKWFAWHSRKGDAWVFAFERAMCDLADNWLARGMWREVSPASGTACNPPPR